MATNRDGLKWVQESIWGKEPRWTKQPDVPTIERLARKHLNLGNAQSNRCDITFFAQGGFNKLYKIQTDARCWLMRVTLPVDPMNKTRSEVETINFVRAKTDIPVPQIVAFSDVAQDSELGFEWILEEMMPGTQMKMAWRKLSIAAKGNLINQLAGYHAQLFQHKFSGIGNIFSSDVANDEKVPAVGQIVSMLFFWDDHFLMEVPRGPFANARDWLHARLTLTLSDQESIISHSDVEDDIEEAQSTKKIVERLVALLPTIFENDAKETTFLFHDDLNDNNILVDDTGKITGIVDWECVSVVPAYKACWFPKFLEGCDRNTKPERDGYGSDDSDHQQSEEEPTDTGELGKQSLDNEGKNGMYWIHLLEYEQTVLRREYLDEMRIIAPDWITEFEQGTAKADFELAVEQVTIGWISKPLMQWLDAVERGEGYGLRKSLFPEVDCV